MELTLFRLQKLFFLPSGPKMIFACNIKYLYLGLRCDGRMEEVAQ
jgi:hypothetical protein